MQFVGFENISILDSSVNPVTHLRVHHLIVSRLRQFEGADADAVLGMFPLIASPKNSLVEELCRQSVIRCLWQFIVRWPNAEMKFNINQKRWRSSAVSNSKDSHQARGAEIANDPSAFGVYYRLRAEQRSIRALFDFGDLFGELPRAFLCLVSHRMECVLGNSHIDHSRTNVNSGQARHHNFKAGSSSIPRIRLFSLGWLIRPSGSSWPVMNEA